MCHVLMMCHRAFLTRAFTILKLGAGKPAFKIYTMRLLLLFLLLPFAGAAQLTYYIRSDSTKIEKTGGSNELFIKNASRNVNGILTNIGGGRTQWIGSRLVGDTLFIGKDTIVGVNVNIGNSNLTLSANRTLTMDGKTFTINAGSSMGWAFDPTNTRLTITGDFGLGEGPAIRFLDLDSPTGIFELGSFAGSAALTAEDGDFRSIATIAPGLLQLAVENSDNGKSKSFSMTNNGTVRGAVWESDQDSVGIAYKHDYRDSSLLFHGDRWLPDWGNVLAAIDSANIGGGGGGVVLDSLGYFNVKKYGAVGNGSTDDRVAIQAAVNAAFAAGGGTVYFPKGIYSTGTGFTQQKGQIVIPYSSFAASTDNPTIRFLGEAMTPQVFNPLEAGGSNRLPSNKGVIIQSWIPAGTTGSVISSLGEGGSTWNVMNFTRFEMENITVRLNARNGSGAAAGTKDTAINGFALSMMELDHVTVGVNSPDDSLAQPASTSVGIITPSNSNWVKNDFNDVWVIGVNKAIIAYEHANMDNFYIDACNYGVVLPNTNHAIHGNRMGFWRTKRAIKIEAASPFVPGFTIDQYNNERYTSSDKWFQYEFDLEETNPGQAWGHITSHTVSGSFNFDRSNPAGSRIFATGIGGNGYKWLTANRPNFADTATFGLNQSIGHMEYKPLGTSSSVWNIIPYEGQSRNFWTTGKLGIGGNPNGDTYRVNISDSAGAGPNMIRMHTTGNPVVFMNSTGGSAQMSYQFAKSGTVVYQFGQNFNADATPDFYVYDQVNATAKLYTPNSTGDLFLGANAFTGTGLTILNAGRVGIATTGPTARLHLPAGTATASTAPLKFTSGTNLTTPEAGSVEYNGTSFFFNPSTTRLRAVLTDNSIPSNGMLPIGNGVNYTNALPTSTGNTITITAGAGTLNLDIPTTYVNGGTATPTGTAGTNVDAVTPYTLHWTRVGTTVTFSGTVDIDATVGSGGAIIELSLPIASDFAATTDAAGTVVQGTAPSGTSGWVSGSVANNRLVLTVTAVSTSAATYFFTGSYTVL